MDPVCFIVCIEFFQGRSFQIQEFSIFAEYSYLYILLRKRLRFAWLGEEPEVDSKDTLKNNLSEIVECCLLGRNTLINHLKM